MYYWCDRAMEWVGETPSTPHPHPRFLPFCPIFLLQTTSCSSKASKASNKSSNRNPAIDNILRSCCSPWGPFRPIGQGIIIETERDLRLFFDNISDPARKIRRRPESASCARAKTAMVNERFFSIFCFFSLQSDRCTAGTRAVWASTRASRPRSCASWRRSAKPRRSSAPRNCAPTAAR